MENIEKFIYDRNFLLNKSNNWCYYKLVLLLWRFLLCQEFEVKPISFSGKNKCLQSDDFISDPSCALESVLRIPRTCLLSSGHQLDLLGPVGVKVLRKSVCRQQEEKCLLTSQFEHLAFTAAFISVLCIYIRQFPEAQIQFVDPN